MIEDLLLKTKDKFPEILYKKICISDIVFEQRVVMNCFYCEKYNKNWKCPPKIPDINYKDMFNEYDNAMLLYVKIPFVKNTYDEVRTSSSILLHKALLFLEKQLWGSNNSMAISFIGGSCKLCKNGCGKDACNNPHMARTPLEGTGVNVLKTVSKYGIDINFPPKDEMVRIGMILW